MTDFQIALTTGQYSKIPPDVVPVATSVGKPRWKIPGLETVNELAPYGIFNRKPQPAHQQFFEMYVGRLDQQRAKIIDRLAEIRQVASDADLAEVRLLCWCRITTDDPAHPDGFCHRRMAAWWFCDRLGIEVPERSIVVPDADRLAGVDQPALVPVPGSQPDPTSIAGQLPLFS